MPKRLKIEVLGTDVTAIAELQENDAPETCAALWKALERPIEAKAIHAMYAGPEVFMNIPPENRVFDPTAVPRENATAYPSPGDMAWLYLKAHEERDQPEDFWDLAIAYGREVTFDSALGIRPISVWACITEGLPELAVQLGRIRSDDGPKMLRISRMTDGVGSPL